MTIRAVIMEAFIALGYAEKNDVAPDQQGLRDSDLRILAELFDVLDSARPWDALAILRGA